MRQKTFAVISDALLLVLLLGGVAWLLLSGSAPASWTTDRSMLPLSADGSRLVILLTPVGILLGLVLALVVRRRGDPVVGNEVVRYPIPQRLIHWGMALGYVLAFGSALFLLRWLSLGTTVDSRPLLYQVHFAGAILMVFTGTLFVAFTRARRMDALFPRWQDVSPAIARLFAYLGVYGEPGVFGLRWPRTWQAPTQRMLRGFGIRPNEHEGKFLAAERVLSFTPLASLTVAVLATGLVKSARYFFAVPPDVLAAATWLHDWTTLLTVIVVGAHIAAIVLVPRNWPGIRAMVIGRMPRRIVAHEFPAWEKELRLQEKESVPPPGAAVEGAVRH